MHKINDDFSTPTARLLLDSFRAFEDKLAQALKSKGFTDVTIGNFNILRHLNPEGMRLTALAKDAQISKQAIGKMIKDLDQKEYVELVPDPNDGRAKFVRLTTKGQKLITLAINVVTKMESHYQVMLGKKNYNNLRQSLMHIYECHTNKES